MNDEALIRRIVNRDDRAAANELVHRYYDEIYRYAYRQSLHSTNPKDAALDLTQEIFVSMLRSLPTFRARKAGFRTWLYQVASSRIIDARRKFRPDEVQLDEEGLYQAGDFTVDLQNRELLQRIEKYMDGQPSETQRVYRLHVYGNMTFAQIAEGMGLSEATVKTKFYRAVKKIREVFGDDYRN